MIKSIISAVIAFLDPQVCATPNTFAIVYLEDGPQCEMGTEHLCWSGEWPDPNKGRACCQYNSPVCRFDTAGACAANEYARCDVPVDPWVCQDDPDDPMSVYVSAGSWCKPGQTRVCTFGVVADDPVDKVCCESEDGSGFCRRVDNEMSCPSVTPWVVCETKQTVCSMAGEDAYIEHGQACQPGYMPLCEAGEEWDDPDVRACCSGGACVVVDDVCPADFDHVCDAEPF